jgi:serine/threonine-protein kinase RsbW
MNKTFPASLDHLYEMLSFITSFAKTQNFNSSEISKIELACEEAIVNIVSYAYPESTGDIEIHCLSPKQPGIQIILKDQGVLYNPLYNSSDIDPNPLRRASLGGYGVLFMINLMDEVTYQRENDRNILTLIKYFRIP